ncbi:MAG: hypothetical protein JKY65_18330 [Planctomycetes bacterium]|nr:hypothetical protein [Planctomycetota bacterium]
MSASRAAGMTVAEIREQLEADRPASATKLRELDAAIQAAGGRHQPDADYKAAKAEARRLREEHARASRTPQPTEVRQAEQLAASRARAAVDETKTRALLVAKAASFEAEIMERCGFAGEANPWTEV